MKALEIKKLSKTYSNNVHALKDINLSVEKGDFFALLGPNGAGKSTAIGIISSLVTKNAGEVSICGVDVDENFPLAKSKLGVVNQEFNFSQFEKVQDTIITQAGYYGVDYKTALEKSEKYLKQMGIWDKRNDTLRELSGGQKRRVMIIKSLIHDPELLILDEPTAGVDIELRRGLWDFLIDINNVGTTIILTTHYLEEAENLCKNIAIIDEGKIIENTSMSQLLKQLDSQVFTIETSSNLSAGFSVPGYDIKIEADNKFSITLPKGSSVNNLFSKPELAQIEVTNIANQTNRLEQLFLNLTAKS
jgi:ABC-2 type transport system ATP-binding protein|tara:strand:- start:2033 stop:2944 length:912 start_codon:yes stop_codon:yes gene_type:complete